MTPYSISFQPRYDRGGERRPIADLDGNGLNLRALVNDMLATYKGDELIVSPDDESKSLRVRRQYALEEHTFVEFGIGRGGLEGILHQRNGGRVTYAADDHNEPRVRGMFVFPKNGYEVYWLSERAGQASAYWHVTKLMRELQRESVAAATLTMAPVADWSAIKQWSAAMSVKEIRFDSPRAGSSTQAMNINGSHGDMRVIVKARGMRLNQLLKDDGPDADAVYGYLSEAPLVKESGLTAERIIGQGWAAKVAFTNKAGRQRSFGLNITDEAPTLIYQVGTAPAESDRTSSGVARAYVPSDLEFDTTCAEFLDDISNLLPAETSVVTGIMKNH
jgi:hypothetical protein